MSVLCDYARYSQYIGGFFWLTPLFAVPIGISVCFSSAYILCYLKTHRWWKPYIFPAFLLLLLIPIITNKEIASYTRDPEYRKEVGNRLKDFMKNYQNDRYVRDKWNVYQEELHCCGVISFTDWAPIFGNETLPDKCCCRDYFRPCERVNVKTPKGCRDKLLDLYAISLDGVASFLRELLDPTALF